MNSPTKSGDSPTDGPTGATRPRRSRAELREEVLDTGVRILEEEGPAAVGFRLEAVSFPKVFDRIFAETGRRIVPAMVYERIWASQEEYQWEVLDELIRRTGYASGSTVDTIVDIIREARRGSAEERRATLLALCRIAGAVNIDAALSDREWWTLVAVIGASSSARTTLNDTFVSPAVKQSLKNQTDAYSKSYDWILEAIGYRLRPGFTVERFAMLAGALAEGVALRSKFSPDYKEPFDAMLGSNGASEPWSLFGIGLIALVDTFFEADPDFDPESDIPEVPVIERREDALP